MIVVHFTLAYVQSIHRKFENEGSVQLDFWSHVHVTLHQQPQAKRRKGEAAGT
jgi:hypothetical protein